MLLGTGFAIAQSDLTITVSAVDPESQPAPQLRIQVQTAGEPAITGLTNSI
jgi:hypothetical protein